jgi:hypothetical protein
MFNGRRKNKKNNNLAESSSNSRNNEIVEEIDMNDIKHDTMRSRTTPSDMKNGDATSHFYEDVDRVYSRGQSISIEDAVEEKPKLQRALKARHVN